MLDQSKLAELVSGLAYAARCQDEQAFCAIMETQRCGPQIMGFATIPAGCAIPVCTRTYPDDKPALKIP
jgi:hypothetical protein